MKKLLFVFLILALFSCERDNLKCYQCTLTLTPGYVTEVQTISVDYILMNSQREADFYAQRFSAYRIGVIDGKEIKRYLKMTCIEAPKYYSHK